MDALQEGVSSPDVKKVQALINSYYDASVVPESGEFDGTTTTGLKRFQKDVKLPATGIVDAKTMALLAKPPKVTGYKLKIGSKEYWVDAADWPAARKEFCKPLLKSVEAYQRKVQEGRFLWEAHRDVRKDTFFLIPAMVDAWGGAKFPDEGVIKAAEKAVETMEAAVVAGNIEGLKAIFAAQHAIINQSLRAIMTYRDKMYAGGDNLIADLTTIRDGCVVVLSVSAAVATAGSSVAVTAGVMGGLGAYKEVLNQVDKASKSPNISVKQAVGDVLLAGAIEGTVGALLSKGQFVANLTESLAKQAAAKALQKYGAALVGKVVEKVVKKALDTAVKSALIAIVKAFRPGSKISLMDAIKALVKDLMNRPEVGGVLDGIGTQLDAFSKDYAKYIRTGDLKGLGKVDVGKAMKAGATALFDEAFKRLSEPVALKAADDPGSVSKIPALLVAAFKADGKLNTALAALVKAKNLA